MAAIHARKGHPGTVGGERGLVRIIKWTNGVRAGKLKVRIRFIRRF